MAALTKRALDAAEPRDSEYFLWCGSLAGFGARVYPTGNKVFIAQVRVGRASRRVKIGAFGPFTVEQARERAKAIIQAAADGRNPQREKQQAREAITVAELCERYIEAARAGLVITRLRPARGVETAKGEAKDRTLSTKDLTALGRILNNRQNEMPAAVAALRLIALTGLRREEVCGLRWREVDEVGQCLRLEGTKTGRSTRPIGMAALNLLRAQPREDGVEWVFPRADR